jgi:hypothetical protein
MGDEAERKPPARREYTAFETARSIAGLLIVAAVVCIGVALMAAAPWMRVSPDCSVFCVIEKDLAEYF